MCFWAVLRNKSTVVIICREYSFLRDPKVSHPVSMSAVLNVDEWMCVYIMYGSWIYEPRCRLKNNILNNIKVDLQEVGCVGMDWIELAQRRDRWWALVNAIMNLQVP